MPEQITLSTSLVNQILGYLGTRPYAEVHHMILSAQAEAASQNPQHREQPEDSADFEKLEKPQEKANDLTAEQKRGWMRVTPFQVKAALLQANLLDDVEAIISNPTADPLVKLAWTDAIEYKRLSPMIEGIASTLGWTDEQLDDLFTTAAQITA